MGHAGKRPARSKCAAVIAVLGLFALSLVPAGLASTTYDLRGTWVITGQFSGTNSITSMDLATGRFSGRGTATNGTGYTWPDTGTVTGNKVHWTFGPYDQLKSYTSTCNGTISSDGSAITGDCSDTNGLVGTPGSWVIKRAGRSPGAPPPPPVLGKSADAAPVSGVILLELPGKTAFTRLRAGQRIPLGSTIDATNGVVRLTAAKDRTGHTATGRFYAGGFRIGQRRAAGGELTRLTLVGPKPTGCKPTHAVDAKGHPHRSLWGQASGSYSTVGGYAAATERGTKWLVEDTCAGTLVKVAQGSVIVDDFPHHRTVIVTAPHSFLAHPGTGG